MKVEFIAFLVVSSGLVLAWFIQEICIQVYIVCKQWSPCFWEGETETLQRNVNWNVIPS